MARNKKRRRTKRQEEYPAWVWMLFGLGIGLAVAFAVYINDRKLPAPGQQASTPAPAPARAERAPDEQQSINAPTPPEPAPRFDFYKMLPNYEVVIVEQEPDVEEDTTPQAIVEPGEYVLQAGSFSSFDDADRRRAELALHGIESSIQRVSIDNRRYHRVWIGPTKDLNELNTLRSRLRQADIDVLRIRLGD